ncbi:MAG: J domain-containing protein [Microthrixaceae bacterium]
MSHYEVLGVDATASAAQLRSAYLELARQHHPDFQHGRARSSALKPAGDSEFRMRQINAAWQELGHPVKRSAYDQKLRDAAARQIRGSSALGGAVPAVGATGPRIEQPSTEFTPYWDHDEDDDDSWRFEPDEVNPQTVPHKSLLAAPALSFVIGIVLLAASAPTGIRALFAAGLMFLLLSLFFFGAAPVVAMFKSQIAEESSRSRTAQAKRHPPTDGSAHRSE